MSRHRAVPDELARFRTAMATAAADTEEHFDVWGLDAAGYKQWLAAHRGDPDFILPPGLADKGISACKVIEWDRHPITMLCFKVSGQHLDIFVVKAADFPGLKFDQTPAFLAKDDITTATWLHDGKIYLLAGNMSAADLKKFL
jgi:anti-sigma factor RsiW